MSELYVNHLYHIFTKSTQAKHDVGNALEVLPFFTKTNKSKKIRGNFEIALGEFVRNICNYKLDISKMEMPDIPIKIFDNEDCNEEDKKFIWYFTNKIEIENEDDLRDFQRFLNAYLFDKNNIKIIHPFLFNYIRNNNNNEFRKYGEFMYDILVSKKDKLQEIFDNKSSEDILTDLIVNNRDLLEKVKEKETKYSLLLPSITELYEEDILYLSNYKNYFIKSFPLLTHFYVFMYVCQLVIKFSRFTKADFQTLDPLYFSLEWERLNSRRKAVSALESFRFIKGNLNYLFPHIHTLSQLSHNKANIPESELKGSVKINVFTYPEIIQLINENKLNETAFLSNLHEWMTRYTSIFKKEFVTVYKPTSKNVEEAMKELFQLVVRGTNDEVSKKFGGNLEDLGSYQFIKSRGNIGQVLNITHEFLILLTAVSVKDDRIPLHQLFDEFKRRGINLDRYSRDEVVKSLDRLNLIDKKSDSGDAQYVKRIL